MKGSLRLVRVVGVDVFVHWSFPLIILLMLGQGLYSNRSWESIGFLLLVLLLLYVCVALHELGHALTALSVGVRVKNIILLPIGGVAQIESIPQKPLHDFAITLMGPLVNLIISMIMLFILVVTDSNLLVGFLENPAVMIDAIMLQKPFPPGPVMGIIILLMAANAFLFVFNLIPAFPMDGGRMLRALLATFMSPTRATQLAIAAGQLIAVLFLFLALRWSNLALFILAVFVFLSSIPMRLRHATVRRDYPVKLDE